MPAYPLPFFRAVAVGTFQVLMVVPNWIAGLLCASWLLSQGFAAQEPMYVFTGAELVRTAGGESEVILPSDAKGTGKIHAVARSPLGTTYVAAEHGLFALSDDVRHLAPLTRKEGAPMGTPRGVEVDDRGTIWLATDQGFGSIEPVHLFGRVLKEGRFEGLTRNVDGVLRATYEGGEYQHDPRGAGPAVEILETDKEPVDGVVRVRLASSTNGPALYGHRLHWRHRYRTQASGEFEIRGLEPGRQELCFAVFDQNMHRSQEVSVFVQVPYPTVYSKGVAVPVLLGLGFGTLFLLLFLAWRRGGGSARFLKAFASTFVLFAVGLQILAGVIPHARGWPFVGFTMYSQTYTEGSFSYRARAQGVLADGTLKTFLPGEAGYHSDGEWQVLAPIAYGDPAERAKFLQGYNRRHRKAPFLGFLITDQKTRLTPKGPIRVAPTVMCVYPEGVLDVR